MNSEQVAFEVARLEAVIRTINVNISMAQKKIDDLTEYREFNEIILGKLKTLPEGAETVTLSIEDSKKLLGMTKKLAEK